MAIRRSSAPPRAPDAVDHEVGRRIAARRLALGLSQGTLAARVGVSFQQLQKYEAGLNRVSASRLHRIALALGAPAGAFFPDPETEPASAIGPVPPWLAGLIGSADGRLMAACFPRIADRRVRRALVRLAARLAEPA